MIDEYGKNEVRSKRGLRGALIAIIGILLVLVLLRIAPFAQRIVILPIRKVQIYGNNHVTKREIAAQMGIDVSSSILTFSRRSAREALLEDKRISNVEMAKIYPDTLRIHVREKSALAVINADNGVYWISSDGVVIQNAREKDSIEPYPLITLKSNNVDIKIGERAADFYLLDLLAALKEIQDEYPEFFGRLSSFFVSEEGVRLSLGDESYDVWLGSEVTAQKLGRLRALLVVLKSDQVRLHDEGVPEGGVEIDMSAAHAAVRMREMNYEL